MSPEKTSFDIMLEIEGERYRSTRNLATKHEVVKMLLDYAARISKQLRDAVESYCEECEDTAHLTYQCKHSRIPMLANYNNDKCNVRFVMEYVILLGTGEMLNRLGDIEFRSPSLEWVHKQTILLYKFCFNNFGDNTLVKEYIQRAATAMEKDNLLQDSPKNEEEEEHDEEEEERTDHPLATSTSNSKPI